MKDRSVEDQELKAAGAELGLSQSFEDFFEVEHDRLLGALYLVTGNRADAEELMQDAFVKVWERWNLVQSLSNPTGYLYRTAMNAFRMRVRRAAIAARRLIGIGGDRRDDFDEVVVREDVRRALIELSPRQRAALVLTELLGYSASEAGETLGIKASTVRALSTQGRAALRSTMGETGE